MSMMPDPVDDDRDGEEAVLESEPLRFLPFELKFREWNLPFEFVPDFPLDRLRRDPLVQVRQSANIAPKHRVEEYAQQMRNGAKFPPLLIRSPDILGDGNTRVAAAQRIGRKTFPAYVVNTRRPEMALILAAAMNQMGGERLTATEAHGAAELMMREGYPDAAIAREIGRDISQVRRWRLQKDVLERAGRLGLTDHVDLINKNAWPALASVTHDAPFAELTKLVAATRPSVKDVKEMTTRVLQATSDAEAVGIINEYREELAPAGPPPHVANRNKEAGLARMGLGIIAKFKDRPTAAFDPTKRDEELERWLEALRVVEAVVAALRGEDR